MRRVLGISSSPRIGSNSETLLDSFLSGSSAAGLKTEKIVLGKLRISPCTGCDECYKDGTCTIRDDMYLIYKKISTADFIAVAGPIYFGSVPAQLKIVIDRFQSVWVGRYILNTIPKKNHKKGVLLVTGSENRRDFFENAKAIVKNFFKILDISYFDELFVPYMHKRGDIKNNKKILKKAYNIGKSLARIH